MILFEALWADSKDTLADSDIEQIDYVLVFPIRSIVPFDDILATQNRHQPRLYRVIDSTIVASL